MTTTLSIDQGTSGTKAVVVDGDDRVLAIAERSLRPDYLPHGGVEQDPVGLLESVLDAGREAVARSGATIDVVTLANQGESVLAWDPSTGAPLSPVIVWQDRRAESICDGLRDVSAEIAARTGLVLDPYFSAPKMAWIRNVLTTDGVVTTTDTWILARLTGEFVTDATTASRSLLLDLDAGEWDAGLLDRFGLAGERLPDIVANDVVVGRTDAFGRSVPVGGVIVDQQAALVGEACLRAGEGKCTFGTGAFLLVNTADVPVRSTVGLATSIGWRTGGVDAYCLDGQIYTVASAVRWLQQLGLIAGAEDLDRVAGSDSGGVLSVPALAGLAAPWWRPEATATWSGMTLSTTADQLVLAVLEGIAAQVAELARCMATDLGRPLEVLRVDGGLTRSRALMQAVADIAQLPLEVYPSPHATALGAVATARTAVEPGRSLQDAVIAWSPDWTFEPQWSAARAAEFSARWTAAAGASA